MKFAASLLSVIGIAQANFRSGSVSTYEKFRYGKFVTRMKAPDRKGTVASFFTYWDGPNFDPNEWNELDMEIVPSVEENPYSMNIIYGDGHEKVESHDYAHRFDPHDDWHVYEMEWTPHYVSWRIDGREMRHVEMEDPAVHHLDKAQSLRMNFWTPTFHSWGAGFNPVDMPWYVLYDYVEVFTYDEEHNEFKFHWRDDFDSFDSGKWHKAAGGFESNTSVFHPGNAYTSGGHLVLKMEPEHTRAEDLEIRQSLHDAFGMDLDHRKLNPRRLEKFRGRNNDFSDTSSSEWSDYESQDAGYDHHDMKYVDHHDDYYKGEHGDYFVDHHDKVGHEHKDQEWSVRHPHLAKKHHERREDYHHKRREERRPDYYREAHHEDVGRHYRRHQVEHEESGDDQYAHLYHQPALHEDEDYYHRPVHHSRRHRRRPVSHHYRSESEFSSESDSDSTDSEAELEDYHRHTGHGYHARGHYERKVDPHYPGHHPEDVHYPGHHPEEKTHYSRHERPVHVDRHHDSEFYTKHYEHDEEQESEKSEEETHREVRSEDDEKARKKEAKRQKKLAKKQRKAEEMRQAEMRVEGSDMWHLKDTGSDSEEKVSKDFEQQTKSPVEQYRHVVPPHGSSGQFRKLKDQKTEKKVQEEKSTSTGRLTPREPAKAKFQDSKKPINPEPKHTFQEPQSKHTPQEMRHSFQEPKKAPQTQPKSPTKPTTAEPESKAPSDPSQMSYDQFRLWKHQQKLAKKQLKFQHKKSQFGKPEPVQEEEPNFRTYGEYRRWKEEQKTQKTQAKQHLKQEKESAKYARQQAKAEAKADSKDKYDLFQHSQPSTQTEEKFQHPIKQTKQTPEPTYQTALEKEQMKWEQKQAKKTQKEQKHEAEYELKQRERPAKLEKEQLKFQHTQQKEQKKEEERTLQERAKAAKTHHFEKSEPSEKYQKKERKYAGERRHGADYHHEEADHRWRHDHKHAHLEDHHRYDLYDFDDPMSDSDYDDLDEETGIYHDEDPHWHSSHHVKHHYSDEQYYHARDRYFPEDSYRAAGQMKYDVVPTDTLIAHALGTKPKPSEPVKKPVPPVAPKKAPTPATKTTPAPAPPAPQPAAPTPQPAPTPAKVPTPTTAPPTPPKQTHHAGIHDEKPLIVAKPPTRTSKHKSTHRDVHGPIHAAGHPPASHSTLSKESHFKHPRFSLTTPHDRHIEPQRFQATSPHDAPKPTTTLPYGVGKDVELTIDAHGHITQETHDHSLGKTTTHAKPILSTKKVDDHHPVAKVPVPHLPSDEPQHHEQTSHEQVKATVPVAAHHEKRHKLTAKEVADLRVKHGLQYEKEHSVEHYIEEVTHPEYKITGWIGGEDHDYWRQHDLYAHDHEEERYGDEHDEQVAHLHLHPKRHDRTTHHKASKHHDKSHHKSSHHAPRHDYHSTEYVQQHHEEHAEVQPWGEQWHEVRRHHSPKRHHSRHEVVPQHHSEVDEHALKHYAAEVETPLHYEEPAHAYYAHDYSGHYASTHHEEPEYHTVAYHPRHDPIIATLPTYYVAEQPVVHHEPVQTTTDYHYSEKPLSTHHEYPVHHEKAQDHYYGEKHDSKKQHHGDADRHYDFPIVSELSKHGYSYSAPVSHDLGDLEHLLPHSVRHDSEHKGYHPELDHRFDDQSDVEPVHFHEHAVLRAPDLPDHHSYHSKDVHHRWQPIHHEHGPVYHEDYSHERHGHETGAQHPSTYYDIETLKQHEQKHEAARPDFGMDFGQSKSKFYSRSEKSTGSSDHEKAKKADSREVEYIIDSKGHVRELVPL